jgi:putative Mg2+ transporter-C (MgtC) family protein
MILLEEEVLVKLCISALLGLVIGLERELKRKPLGLKTSPVIAIISCLLTIVSVESPYMYSSSDGVRIQMDPLRLAAQIVSGIGFLGAGVILKRGNDISGLTTAAMIWGAAGIGIAVGAGFYLEAVAVVVLLIITVEVIPFILVGPLKWLKKEYSIKITVHKRNSIEQILRSLKAEKITITQTRIKDLKNESYHLLELRTRVSSKISVTNLYYTIANMDDVAEIEIMN